MTINDVTEIMGNGLYTIVITAAPVLLVSLIIGLTVSIFQTITSIQEQTLTFVPKLLCVFLTLILLGHWMLNNMITFMTGLWSNFAVYIR